MKQNIEYRFYEKFDNDINQEIEEIKMSLEKVQDERNYILKKL